MQTRTAILLATLVAISQAAPQLEQPSGGSQATNSSSSAAGAASTGASSTPAGTSTSAATPQPQQQQGSQPAAAVFPSISNLLPSFSLPGTSGSSGAENPVAAIISIIPNAINRERDRFGGAVQQLVSQNMNAATDAIGTAAQTGGALLSSGVKAAAAWPAFWGNLLG